MDLYLQNILRNSKNIPGLIPRESLFEINDNINAPVRQHIDVVINFFSGFAGKCRAEN
nr:MAG TPA: hypothetical protein [Caudoviricetes sp.]